MKTRKPRLAQQWKFQPPKEGEPETKTVGDRPWYWCQKCNDGKGRWSTTHNTKQHTGGAKGGKSAKKNHKVRFQHSANSTAGNEPSEQDLGVWCTAVDTVDDSPYDVSVMTPIFYVTMGILLGIFTMYKGYQLDNCLTTYQFPIPTLLCSLYHSLFSGFIVWTFYSVSKL